MPSSRLAHLVYCAFVVTLVLSDSARAQTTDPKAAAVSSAAPSTASSSGTPPSPLSEALTLFRKGDFDDAIRDYQQFLEQNPASSEAYAGLTRVYLKKKDVQHASETANKGLAVAESPTLRVALGEVLFRQGRIHDAEDAWVNVINSGHQDARAYLGLARVHWAVSMNKTARTMIDTAHDLDPSDPEIRKLWIRKLGRAEQMKFLEDYLAGNNNDDEETQNAMRHFLEYLKARAKDSRGSCHLTSKVITTDAELVRLWAATSLRGYGLGVDINGRNAKLLLDTGASGIMINRKLAEKANLTRLSDTEIGGIGDNKNQGGYVGLADSLKIGDLEFQNCTVRVLDQRSVTGEDGLIGTDVFSGFLVDLDFPHETLHLRELPKRPDDTNSTLALQTENESETRKDESSEKSADRPAASTPKKSEPRGPQDRYIAPEMQSYTRVFRFGHALLVPTFVSDGNVPSKLFMLDTGAFANLISTDAAKEVTRVHGDYGTNLKGLSGSVKKVYRADKATLKFGHLQQENQDLLAFDLNHLSNNLGTEVSGMLGFSMLRLLEIKIDYRDGLVDFEYAPGGFKHE